MATINLVIPPLQSESFSGGIICLLEYARGLRSRSHRVNLIPLLPCPRPRWFSGDIGWLPDSGVSVRLLRIARALTRSLSKRDGCRSTAVTSSLALLSPQLFSFELQVALGTIYAREILQEQLPPADVTMATAFTTALVVHLYGTGKKFYFAQHFEPYFAIDLPDPVQIEHEARETYRMSLQLIANSSWLQSKLREEVGAEALLCPNAIDHTTFIGAPKTGALKKEVRIISYGGRGARWKGFEEMAVGVRLARERLPGIKLRWLVYGPCILEPSNRVAEYETLGFLNPAKLAVAYRSADILLSASWYESFPLFPLEAMACGLPVITSQFGTEEYAVHGVTAEIIVPRDPGSIANSLVRLVTQDEYRVSIAKQGNEIARKFNWKASVDRMEAILLN